jgi:predicted transcriptional regulator
MTKDVLQMDISGTVKDAAQAMAEVKTGSILITENGNLAGIISERDILNAFGKGNMDALNGSVQDFMTSNLQTVTPDSSVISAEAIMRRGRFRHLPIVEDGKLLGMISSKDVLRAMFQTAEDYSEIQSEELESYNTTIGDVQIDNMRVLIVDDSAAVRAMLSNLVMSLKCLVETAVDGKDGYKKALTFKPQFIISVYFTSDIVPS